MIEKLITYKHNNIRYVFTRDDRFTIAHADVKTEKGEYKYMVGAAFCTREDEYRVDIGCHIALERMCKNLKLDREKRIELHNVLEENLANKFVAKQLEDAIKHAIKHAINGFPVENIEFEIINIIEE